MGRVLLKTTMLRKDCEGIVKKYCEEFDREFIEDRFLQVLNEKYSWYK